MGLSFFFQANKEHDAFSKDLHDKKISEEDGNGN